MKNFVLALLLTASATHAATLYLNDGTQLDLPVGSRVYISEGQLWEFTRFNEGGFDIRPLVPSVQVTESCTQDTGFTFGGGSYSCSEEVVVEPEPEEETEECDSLTFGGSGC
jgi:hypothetical protein